MRCDALLRADSGRSLARGGARWKLLNTSGGVPDLWGPRPGSGAPPQHPTKNVSHSGGAMLFDVVAVLRTFETGRYNRGSGWMACAGDGLTSISAEDSGMGQVEVLYGRDDLQAAKDFVMERLMTTPIHK